jgi:CheY-like chemotaxis protein
MTDNKATILIVDDEPFNIEIIMEYLEDEGYELRSAEDGLDAWNQLQAEPEVFDLILLDRMMPNMDGMETLDKIKSHPQLMDLPVILQTALASKQDIADGMKAGAYYYLTKPFEEDMLRSVIATAVEDRLRYRTVQEGVDQPTHIDQLMSDGKLSFRSLDEAREVATMLSGLCPEPQRVVVGMSELLINAVEHGNLGITYEEKGALKENGSWQQEVEKRLDMPEYSSRQVTIEMEKTDSHIYFKITDEGDGFEFSNFLEMDPDRAFDNHGRGIAMSRMLSFDTLDFIGKGNQVKVGVKL